jgi:hypothetical protein
VNGVRWTTGIGIAVGGVGGAIAALMGAPRSPAPPPPAPRSAPQPAAEAVATAAATAAAAEPTTAAAPTTVTAAAATPPLASASASVPAATPAAPVIAPPALEVPATREALLKAELFCDQKKDFDECARAATALETGTTGPVDLEQAKRFRRIALTHLVAQCETDSPHACFVLAAKYRAGTELGSKPASAEALEKRGAELCRLGRPAPECPTP